MVQIPHINPDNMAAPGTIPERYVHLYQEATPAVGQLIDDPDSASAQKDLERVNIAIKEENQEKGYGESDGVIPIQNFVKQLKDYRDLARQAPDTLTESQLLAFTQNWETALREHGFPESWGIFKYDGLYRQAENCFQQYLNTRNRQWLKQAAQINLRIEEEFRFDEGWFNAFFNEYQTYLNVLGANLEDTQKWRKYGVWAEESIEYLRAHHFKKLALPELNPEKLKAHLEALLEYYTRVYRSAQGLLNSLLDNPDDKNTEQALRDINEKQIGDPIYEIPVDTWIPLFKKAGEEAQAALQNDDRAYRDYNKLRDEFHKRINDSPFPKYWELPDISQRKAAAEAAAAQASVPQAAVPQAAVPQAAVPQAAVLQAAAQAAAPQAAAPQAAATQAAAPQAAVLQAAAQAAAAQAAVAATQTAASRVVPAAEWKPGLTEELHQILGHVNNNRFAVYRPEASNKIALVDTSDLPDWVVRGYQEVLPPEQRHDLSSKGKQYDSTDKKYFVKIIGFDCLVETDPRRYPAGLVLCEWTDGTLKAMNRTAFRRLLSKTPVADKMIEVFLEGIGEGNKFTKRVNDRRSRTPSHTPSPTPEEPRFTSPPRSMSRSRSASISHRDDNKNDLTTLRLDRLERQQDEMERKLRDVLILGEKVDKLDQKMDNIQTLITTALAGGRSV
ncbi:hypothetical protein EIK77_003912 [Talaromyces pinophilus]|nr:hypothetical protein EIK77_003912 [Talaromyces pinophilus]